MKKIEFVTVSKNISRLFALATIGYKGFSFQVEGGMSTALEGKDFAECLPSKVTAIKCEETPRQIWNYQAGEGMAYLREYQGEPFIIIINKSLGITQAISLYDLATRPIVSINGVKTMAGIDIEKVIAVKRLASSEFKTRPVFSNDEKMFSEIIDQIETQKRELALQALIAKRNQEEAENKARHEDAVRKRAIIYAEIMSRKKISAFKSGDIRCWGIPVVSEEWKMLKNDTAVILVESYEYGIAGKVIEAFFVSKKDGAGASKKHTVTVKEFSSTDEAIQKALGRKIFLIDGKINMIDVYPDSDSVNQLKNKGLNSGSLVACPISKVDENGTGMDSAMFTLYRVTEKQTTTVGVYTPFSVSK